MMKKIKIYYDIDYGIFTVKIKGFSISKAKLNKFQSKIKKKIDDMLKELIKD